MNLGATGNPGAHLGSNARQGAYGMGHHATAPSKETRTRWQPQVVVTRCGGPSAMG